MQFMQGGYLQVGETVDGHFQVTGAGEPAEGSGVGVHRGVDCRTGGQVLIKAAQVGSPGAAELAREHSTVRRLSDPGLPQVLDYGEDGRGAVLLILSDPGDVVLTEASVGICSDAGRLRTANEDRHAVVQVSTADGLPCALYILSDGMGGEAGGVVASSITVETVRATLCRALPLLRAKEAADVVWLLLQHAVSRASQAVFERAGREPALSRMGATVVIGLQLGSCLYVANVGDSRAYRVCDGNPEQLSQDHTVVARLIARGDLRPEHAQAHPARGQLTRNIGARPAAQAHFAVCTLHKGDLVLLCCDGLTDMAADVEIAALLVQAPNPQAAAERLIALANSRGGPDNISAIVSQYSGGAQ